MTRQPLRVLLVDDEASLREPLAQHLRQTFGYQVDTAADAQAALTQLEETGGHYDVALIDDLLLPEPGQAPKPLGVALTKEIKARYPNIEVIVFTGWGMKSALDTLRAGAYRYLAKPVNIEELGLLIQTAAEYRRLNEEADALRELAVSLAGASELEKVASLVLRTARKLTNIDGGSILLWDSQTDRFSKAFRMDSDGKLKPYESRSRFQGMHAARKIIDKRKTLVILDEQQIPDFPPAFLDRGYRASLGVPLLSPREAIGVLYAHSKKPRQFSAHEVALLETLGSQVAVAIDRASQYEELIKAQGLIGATTAVAWMGMVSSVWRHAVANNATTIEDCVALAWQDIDQDAPVEKLRERLDTIAALARKIREASITAPPYTEEGVGSVSINELLQERLSQLWERAPYQSIQLQRNFRLDNRATVRASPEWLRRAFDMLIDNAVQAMAQSPTKQLTITTQQVDNQVEIIITDTGPGIPKGVQAKLFQKPIEKPKGAEGSGMGLLITQTILHTYRGEINVKSTGSTGTAMQVLLPFEA